MVGLGVVLEEQQPHKKRNVNISKVINKTTMMLSTINNKTSSPLSYHSPFKVSTFLDQCFLCSKKLLPGKDIYMYKLVLGTKINVECIFTFNSISYSIYRSYNAFFFSFLVYVPYRKNTQIFTC